MINRSIRDEEAVKIYKNFTAEQKNIFAKKSGYCDVISDENVDGTYLCGKITNHDDWTTAVLNFSTGIQEEEVHENSEVENLEDDFMYLCGYSRLDARTAASQIGVLEY